MATVTSYTAARMKEIEDSAIVSGTIVGDDLWLTRYDGVQINAGDVRGIQGPTGSTGDTAIEVCTSTTRPVLPYIGAFIYETDTHRVYSWNGTAWVYRGGVVICTSGTRPAGPFAGMSIYETDTLRPYTWNGTSWIYQGGTIICTSTTRPASPFVGLEIYETNTLKTYKWNGTVWVQDNPTAKRCKVSRASQQAVGSSVISNIVWTSEDYDTDNFWSLGGAAERFTIPVGGAGLYRVTLNANWGINSNGVRCFGILLNAATNIAVRTDMPTAYWLVGGTLVGEVVCNAGDFIQAYAYQSSGAVINLEVTYPLSMSIAQII